MDNKEAYERMFNVINLYENANQIHNGISLYVYNNG